MLQFYSDTALQNVSAVDTQIIRDRLKGLPEPIRAVAWKAQVRLSARYRTLIARGKSAPTAIVAVARELVGFIWAIARMVEPKFT